MRVTSVGMYSSLYSEMIEFSLRQVDHESRYIARNIVGLDSEEIIPKFYGFSPDGKSKLYDFGMKARDIVMRVVLNPHFNLGETYSDIRDELYRAISANRTGQTTLHFRSGGATVATIDGMITKFEVAYFNQLPEVQITIKCNDPMFRGLSSVVYDGSSGEFDGQPNPFIMTDSLSTAPHGLVMQFYMYFGDGIPSITIQDKSGSAEWKFTIAPPGGFQATSNIYLSSETNNKYLYMVRNGVTTHLIDAIVPGSVWPLVFPGLNSFWFKERGSIGFTKFEFYPAYWGV